MEVEAVVGEELLRGFIAADHGPAALERVEAFLREGLIEIGGEPAASFRSGSLWSAEKDRRYGRLVHGFVFAKDWLGVRTSLATDKQEELASMIGECLGRWTEESSDPSTMAFHDETTAQRVMYLSAVVRDFSAFLRPVERDAMLQRIRRDVDLLSSSDFYAGVNNHGMFQDIAILFAVAFGVVDEASGPKRDLAFSRLLQYFSSAFTADGIHVENSPTYHLMVCRHLKRVVDYASAVDRDAEFAPLREILPKADQYAAFALSPGGVFPPVSDSAPNKIHLDAARDAFGSGLLAGVVSRAVAGPLPETNVLVAEASGYAIYRDGWAQDAGSQVFFSAAYNADYHKHSDELSVYVNLEGRELLREAGPFGYDRRDPRTAYGFSSFAHNTLIVDGEGLPRTDGLHDETGLIDLGSSERRLHVKGWTKRYPGILWERELTIDAPLSDGGLAIRDRVRADSHRQYTFLWHLGQDVNVLTRGNVIELFATDEGGEKLAELAWSGSPPTGVRVVRGQSLPTIQGWQFPKMGTAVPASVLEVDFEGADLEVLWTLATSAFSIRDRGIRPRSSWKSFPGEKPVNYLLDVPAGEVPEELLIVFSAIHQRGDFTFNYRSSLQRAQAAKLFILDDFGDQGAYYLSSNRNFAEFRSVQGLIHTVLRRLGLGPSSVTTIGSSKGGSAAIMHGTAIGAGKVVAAAPQFRIGTFLSAPHPNILKYITGGVDDESVKWLDQAMARVLRSGVREVPIEIIVGEADHHLAHHVEPLSRLARSLGYNVSTLRVPGASHKEVGGLFSRYLDSWVAFQASEPGEAPAVYPHIVSADEAGRSLGVAVGDVKGARYGFRLYKDSEAQDAFVWARGNSMTWKIRDRGLYRARVYVDFPDRGVRHAFGTKSVRI